MDKFFKPENEKLIKRIYRFILLFIVLPALILLFLLVFYALPTYSGTFDSSLSLKPLAIKRNEFGIPSIEAEKLSDAYYGLGIVHAQDRLWAMECLRRFGSGRLSEMAGKQAFNVDKFFKNLSLRRYAEYSVAHLDEETKLFLENYVQGVNDYVKSLIILPFEFWFQWINFEPWTIVDSILLAKYYSFFLASDWNYELLQYELTDLFGEDIAKEINPYTSELSLWSDTVTINDEELKSMNLHKVYHEGDNITEKFNFTPEPERNVHTFNSSTQAYFKSNTAEVNSDNSGIADQEIKKLKKETQVGSNLFAVHGKHTASGKPLLANDPHMETKVPSAFMQTQIVYGNEYISGVSMPGFPAILAGKTKHISWGIAAAAVDTADIYVIEVEDGKYLYEGSWIPLKSYEEVIYLPVENPVTIRIFETHHGIVLDYFLKEVFVKRNFALPLDKKFVLAWTGYVHKETTISAFNALARAKNTNEIIDSQKNTILPSLAVTFATSSGDIGFLPIGRIPIRRDPRSGIKPKIGSQRENDWIGYLSMDQTPKLINPPKGYIVSCNNKITSDNSLYHLFINQVGTTRAVRATEIISNWINKGHKINIEDMKSLQSDTLDIVAREFNSLLISHLRKAISREYFQFKKIPKTTILDFVQVLEKWDYNTSSTSIEASIFNVWTKRFASFFLEESPLNTNARLSLLSSQRADHFVFGRIKTWQNKDKSHNFRDYWCVNKDNSREFACLATLARAFEEALSYLNDKIHLKSEKWQWGIVHTWAYKHYPLTNSMLKALYKKEVRNGGNDRTIFTAGTDSSVLNVAWTPAYRMVISMEPTDKNWLIIETGINGQRFSPHYLDQLDIYHNMNYIEMVQDRLNGNEVKVLEVKSSKGMQGEL